MPIYQAPLRDYQFVLNELLNIYQQDELFGFDEIDPELIDAVLQGVADFTTDIMLPLNGTGDVEGCKLVDGKVVTPTGFIEAYQQYVDNGWATLTCDPKYGGQGLPGGRGRPQPQAEVLHLQHRRRLPGPLHHLRGLGVQALPEALHLQRRLPPQQHPGDLRHQDRQVRLL